MANVPIERENSIVFVHSSKRRLFQRFMLDTSPIHHMLPRFCQKCPKLLKAAYSC